MSKVSKSINIAKNAHKFQKRKDNKTPYINHPLDLYEILLNNKVKNKNILSAALLHDVIEDTEYTKNRLSKEIGKKITNIVLECSDDKNLSKVLRKEEQIKHSLNIGEEAIIVKLVNKIANLKDMLISPPVGWNIDRILGYVIWSKKVVDSLLNNRNIKKYKNIRNNLINEHTFLVLEIFEEYKIDINNSEDIYELYLEKLK